METLRPNPKYDVTAEFKFPIKTLKSPLKDTHLSRKKSYHMSKSRTVFPFLNSETITLLIFSYLDVHHRAIDFLKRLNSKGYDISKMSISKNMFEVYLKS